MFLEELVKTDYIEKDIYWNKYYNSCEVPELPSQFAVFVLGEINPAAIIDIGCGSGRDALYFAGRGIPTIGIDGSASAVDLCNQKISKIGKADFLHLNAKDGQICDAVEKKLLSWGVHNSILIYARFFIHAINEEDQALFLSNASYLLDKFDGTLAVEFRTPQDQMMCKVTPGHYRRFVDPKQFELSGARHKLKVSYFQQGQGFAKYKEDDAHVARFLMTKQIV